jgi:hypothetical protein
MIPDPRNSAMPRTPTLLANSLEPLTRSLLLSFGLDHAFIDFLALTAIGAATVLLAILAVALRIPDRQSAPSFPRIPE